MAAIATVKIDDGKGDYVVINEMDFDPKQHQRWKAKGKSKAKAPPSSDSGPTAGDSDQTVATDVNARSINPLAQAIALRTQTLQDEKTVPELKAIAAEMNLEIKSKARQAEIAEAIARAELSKG
ncbi:MAG: hypothetical protein AAFN08_06750 [Cyanobacteria bacterium J06559_3]